MFNQIFHKKIEDLWRLLQTVMNLLLLNLINIFLIAKKM